MEKLKYISSEKYYEGVIAEIHGGAVTINLKGRLGQFKIPNRMLITDYEVKIGQEVGFMLSNPEVLGPDPVDEYLEDLIRAKKFQEKKKLEDMSRLDKELDKKRKELEELELLIQKTKEDLL